MIRSLAFVAALLAAAPAFAACRIYVDEVAYGANRHGYAWVKLPAEQRDLVAYNFNHTGKLTDYAPDAVYTLTISAADENDDGAARTGGTVVFFAKANQCVMFEFPADADTMTKLLTPHEGG